MKSNTTRRSQPMTRSRLRKPTSKSMTTVLWPRMASPAEIAAPRIDLRARPHRLRHESRLPGGAILGGAVLGAFGARASAAAGRHAEDRETGRRGEAALHGARALHAHRDQAMLAQELLQR